jgi:hypothetical protein
MGRPRKDKQAPSPNADEDPILSAKPECIEPDDEFDEDDDDPEEELISAPALKPTVIHSEMDRPTRNEMELLGYSFVRKSVCGAISPGCRQDIELWASPKGGATININPMPTPHSLWVPHDPGCPNTPKKRSAK